MRLEENVFLDRLGNDYAAPIMEEGASFERLKRAFKELEINLEMGKSSVTWVMSESLVGEIEKAMPRLIEIAEKPRTFIETHDEKLLVESARRIGHKAIAELSRDSKDWYARTFLTVKPKFISAEVSEETYGIYENRVFVSLIKRLEKALCAKKKDVEESMRKLEASLSSKSIDDFFGLNGNENSAWSFNLYKKATWKQEDYVDDSALDPYWEMLAKIETMLRQLSRIRSSKMFRALAKVKREHSPLLKTNLFLYDRNYKTVFLLWKELDKDKFANDREVEEDAVDLDQCEINYGLYVFLSFLYAFADMGFVSLPSSGLAFYDFERTYCDQPLILMKDGKTFRLYGDSADKHFSLDYEFGEGKNRISKSYRINLDYESFEDLNPQDFDANTKAILDGSISNQKGRKAKPINCISFDGANSELGQALGEKLCRRVLSLGESFSMLEKVEDLQKWGNYQTGFLDIYPRKNFRNNLLKIERFLSLVSFADLSLNSLQENRVCPICGHQALKKSATEGTDFKCNNCHHLVSYTHHADCKSQKKDGKLLYIAPASIGFLEQQKERFHFEDKRNCFSLIEFTQFALGKYATIGIEASLGKNGKVEQHTICPSCGCVLKKESDEN